jgi:hypothetical protein
MATFVTLLPLLIQLTGVVASHYATGKTGAEVITAAQQLGIVAATIAKMQEEGRAQTTEQEQAALVDVLGRRAIEDARFDADLPKLG